MAFRDRRSYAMALGIQDGPHLDMPTAAMGTDSPGMALVVRPRHRLQRVQVTWWTDNAVREQMRLYSPHTIGLDVLCDMAADYAGRTP